MKGRGEAIEEAIPSLSTPITSLPLSLSPIPKYHWTPPPK